MFFALSHAREIIEGTKGTEGTIDLLILILEVPSTLQTGGLLMSEDFSPELGLTQEEFLQRLLSQGLARKVKKRIGGQIYEVLAIDGKVLEGLRK